MKTTKERPEDKDSLDHHLQKAVTAGSLWVSLWIPLRLIFEGDTQQALQVFMQVMLGSGQTPAQSRPDACLAGLPAEQERHKQRHAYAQEDECSEGTTSRAEGSNHWPRGPQASEGAETLRCSLFLSSGNWRVSQLWPVCAKACGRRRLKKPLSGGHAWLTSGKAS